MTDRLINILLLKLKLLFILLLVALFSILFFSFRTTSMALDDFWKQLGMTREQGTDGVKQSFLNGYLYYYGARNFKNIALNNRPAIARDLCQYTKQYVNSPSFKKEYEQMRVAAKPVEPENKVRSKEEIRKEKIAETQESIRKTEATIKQMGADMAKIMQPTLQVMKKTLVDYKDPNSKYIEAYYLGEKNENESRLRSYKERYARWEKEYPADYRDKIRERLHKFLELAATVDFNAELKQVGNKKKFVNPVYEAKSYDWKQVYRAGKEVIEPARQFAEQWIAELNSTSKNNMAAN